MNQICEYNQILKFIDEYYHQYEIEKLRLPYHINIIDELHINENGHSRILYRFLQFVNEKGEYEILQSLVDYVIYVMRKESVFSKIHIKHPIITQEEERIDLWVRDFDYAIIFENKIYNASDQDAQLFRYIERTNQKCSYKLDDIFIIYLSSKGERPSSQTWGNANYEELFADRYVNLSFKDHILPWLTKWVLPSIRIKDTYLQSSIQQYIDYLEGLFLLRSTQKQMNTSIEKIIKQHLDLESKNNEDECLEALSELSKKLDMIQNTADNIAREYISKLLNNTKNELLKNNIVVDISDSEEYKSCYIALSIPYNNKIIVVNIAQSRLLYCQVEYDHRTVRKEDIKSFQHTPLANHLKSIILEQKNDTGVWKYFGTPNDFRNHIAVIKCFKNTVETCVDFISKEQNRS